MIEHKTMTYEQVAYNPAQDCTTTLEEGLDRLGRQGWLLVASYLAPVHLPVAQRTITVFVFRCVR
jgi:hypothetical protein